MVLAPYQKAVGRPPTITLESVGAIIADVRFGLTFYTASRGQGLSYHRALRWKREGERLMALDEWNPALMTEAQCLYFLLAQGVGVAQAEFEREQIQGIKREGKGDWRSHAWLLERSNPAEWSGNPRLRRPPEPWELGLMIVAQPQESAWDNLGPQTLAQMAISHLRDLRELNAAGEYAEVIEQLEQDWEWPAGRYPVRRAEPVEGDQSASSHRARRACAGLNGSCTAAA